MATFLAIPTAIAFTPFTKSVFVFASAAQLFAMSSSSYPYASRSNLNRLRQHGCGKNRNRYGSGDGQHTNVHRSPPLTARSAYPWLPQRQLFSSHSGDSEGPNSGRPFVSRYVEAWGTGTARHLPSGTGVASHTFRSK